MNSAIGPSLPAPRLRPSGRDRRGGILKDELSTPALLRDVSVGRPAGASGAAEFFARRGGSGAATGGRSASERIESSHLHRCQRQRIQRPDASGAAGFRSGL